MAQGWTKEQIEAAVDRSLDGPEAEAVRSALETDPDARGYAEELHRLNATLRDAFDVPSDEPVPAPIAAAIFGQANTVSMVARSRRHLRVWIPASVAACLALAVAAALYVSIDDRTAPPTVALGAADPDGPLHLALERLPSGSTSPEGIRPMLTFRDRDGWPCREFEVDEASGADLSQGLACRSSAGRWRVEVLVAVPGAKPVGDGYAPASGPGTDALDAATRSLGLGMPLAPDEEASLIADGWRRPD